MTADAARRASERGATAADGTARTTGQVDAIARLRATGLVPGATLIDSPNHDARPSGAAPEILVIHNISLPPRNFGGQAIVELFTNTLDPATHPYYPTIADLRVSAHLLIRRNGSLIQFVRCHERAWHAGLSLWKGRERCNDFSIGIELEGTDDFPFTYAQYAKLIGVASLIVQAYGIRHAAGHSDIAPGRKTDPGPHFNWKLFRAATGLR